MPDSQSREPGFESPLLLFRSLGILFHSKTPQFTYLYKEVSDHRQRWKCQWCLCAFIAVWLNVSQRSRVGVVMNRFAREWNVKRFEQSIGLDTALYKIQLYTYLCMVWPGIWDVWVSSLQKGNWATSTTDFLQGTRPRRNTRWRDATHLIIREPILAEFQNLKTGCGNHRACKFTCQNYTMVSHVWGGSLNALKSAAVDGYFFIIFLFKTYLYMVAHSE